MGLQQKLKAQSQDRGNDAADTDGEAAHGALRPAHLQRLGGPEGVGRGADGHASGDGIGEPEQAAGGGGGDVADHAGDDDDHGAPKMKIKRSKMILAISCHYLIACDVYHVLHLIFLERR